MTECIIDGLSILDTILLSIALPFLTALHGYTQL